MANEIGKGTLCTFHTALTLIQMNKLTRLGAKNSNGRGKKKLSPASAFTSLSVSFDSF